MDVPLKHPATRWKLTLALLFVLFLVGMTVSLALAVRRGSRVVDIDYYSHGLHYGKTCSGAANPGLGWKMSAALIGDALQVCVIDQRGTPLSGGKLSLLDDNDPSHSTTIRLAEQDAGSFTAPKSIMSRGEFRGTLIFTRGEAVASRKLVLFN